MFTMNSNSGSDVIMNSSQVSPTPSGQLSDPFKNMCLASQQRLIQDGIVSQRPPVPLFSQAVARPSQLPLQAENNDVPCSQLEPLETQDFITPADQFGLEYDPGAANGARHQRSPAQLSPNRIKRARKDAAIEDDSRSLGAPTAPINGTSASQLRPPRVARVRSPPCYRNIFSDNENEEDYSLWRDALAASASQLSRYRCDFKELGMLGQGSFSKVFRVRHRLDGKEYAVKRTIKDVLRKTPEFLQFLQEVQVLGNTPIHPNIIRYFTSWTEAGVDGGERLYMQLELCSGALGLHAALGERLQESHLVEIARQLAQALAHLHQHHVAHMDIKPSNVYILLPPEENNDSDNEDTTSNNSFIPPGTIFKLGDFGQAALTTHNGKEQQEIAVNEGDSRYLPLEVMNSDYSRLDKADMFSLGATLFELASGRELPTGGQPYEDLRRGKVPLLPTVTTSFMRLIRLLLSTNPDDRPSATKMLQMAPICLKKQNMDSSAQKHTGQENIKSVNVASPNTLDLSYIKTTTGTIGTACQAT